LSCRFFFIVDLLQIDKTFLPWLIAFLFVCISVSISVGLALMPAPETETQSPEPTTFALTTETQSPEPTSYEISKCEGQPAELKCASGTILDGKITYGRWDTTLCPHFTVTESTEKKQKEYQLDVGLGQSEHTLDGNMNTLLGEDIYPGVFKHYTVNYRCQ
jgi:hypothetical protein